MTTCIYMLLRDHDVEYTPYIYTYAIVRPLRLPIMISASTATRYTPHLLAFTPCATSRSGSTIQASGNENLNCHLMTTHY